MFSKNWSYYHIIIMSFANFDYESEFYEVD